MQKIELDRYVGKKVPLNVRETFAADNRPLLQLKPGTNVFYSTLVAVDEIGLWIENAGWKCNRPGTDFVSHRIHVLVPWGVVISIAAFPDRVFPDDEPVPDSKAETIGFHVSF
jgi:hypothetical protein